MAATHPLFKTELPRDWHLRVVDDIKASEKSSCVAGPFGSNISSKYFVDSGVPIIRGNNLRDDLTRFVAEKFAFVSEEQATKYKAQHVRAGDLVFTCWGTLGQVGLIPGNGPFPEYIISNKQLKLRPNLDVADPVYLFFYFACPQMVEHVKNRAIGAAVPGINLGILKALPVVLPPLPIQHKIAAILSAYDDLIENNLRRIKILEEMAQRLYREWFVNFRFPGHQKVRMVNSPLGKIPEGWEAKALRECVSLLSRGLSPCYDEEGDSLVINQKCIRDQRLTLDPARRQSKPFPEEKLIRFGDILINSTGVGTLGRVVQVYENLGNCTVDSHVTIVRPRADIDIDYFGCTLLLQQETFERLGVGATGQTELGRTAIGQVELLVAPKAIQSSFGKAAGSMRAMTIALSKRNTNLRKTRDILLPKLISGELDVSSLDIKIRERSA